VAKRLVDPKDYEAAYVHWSAVEGQIPTEFLDANVVGPYRDNFPLLGG
jgi:hypothetical protein